MSKSPLLTNHMPGEYVWFISDSEGNQTPMEGKIVASIVTVTITSEGWETSVKYRISSSESEELSEEDEDNVFCTFECCSATIEVNRKYAGIPENPDDY